KHRERLGIIRRRRRKLELYAALFHFCRRNFENGAMVQEKAGNTEQQPQGRSPQPKPGVRAPQPFQEPTAGEPTGEKEESPFCLLTSPGLRLCNLTGSRQGAGVDGCSCDLCLHRASPQYFSRSVTWAESGTPGRAEVACPDSK